MVSDKVTLKSCTNCVFSTIPSKPDVLARDILGKPRSASRVCGQLNAVLSIDKETEDAEALEVVASKCGHYEKFNVDTDRPDGNGYESGGLGGDAGPLRIALPLEVVRKDATHPSHKRCFDCEFYVSPVGLEAAEVPLPDSTVGGLASYCAARGVVMDVSSVGGLEAAVAIGCDTFSRIEFDAVEGDYDREMHELGLLDNARPLRHLEAALKDSMGLAHVAPPEPEAEPEPEPEPDLPPGATGWVEFDNDDQTRTVRLPKFDPGFFDEDERAKIPVAGCEGAPDLYVDHANLAYRIAVAWVLGETPALQGPSGTGKTSVFQYMAYRLGLPFERVSITSSSSVDDLAGYMELHGRETVFEQGRIPKAWAKPCVMVIDEPNAGPPEVWQFIRPMTDSAKQLVLDSNHGQVVDRHAHSYLGMAMNPAWDHRNTGVASLADADGSRLLHIFVGYPDQAQEREIIIDHCKAAGVKVGGKELDAIMRISSTLRTLSEAGTLQVSWGIRQQVKVAKLLEYVPFAEAYRMAAADSLEPEQQKLIIDEVNSETAALNRKKRKPARKYEAQSITVTKDGTSTPVRGVVNLQMNTAQMTGAQVVAALQGIGNSKPYGIEVQR